MKKFLILVIEAAVDSHRVKRLIEEIEKRNHKVDLLCSTYAKILTDRVYSDGKEVNFKDYDFVYSVGNDDKHQYISTIARYNSEAKIWPDDLSINDKFVEAVFLNSVEVATPKTILLTKRKNGRLEEAVKEIGGFPCVIKKVTGSEGKYVALADSVEKVNSFIDRLPHPSIIGRKNVILQEYIEESKGTDFRVYCVGREILGAIKRKSQGDDFRANVSLGGQAEKVELSDEMVEYSRKIIKDNKFLLVGIDFIESKRGYLVVELNDSADFKGFERATGIDVAGKIVEEFLKSSN